MDARAIVAAAAADLAQLERVPPAAACKILSTGDELAEPGTARSGPTPIPDSVSFGVAALAARWGAQMHRPRTACATNWPRWSEAAAAIERRGRGSRHRRRIGRREGFRQGDVRAAGLQLIFSKVAIKPGKPVWFGRVGDKLVHGPAGQSDLGAGHGAAAARAADRRADRASQSTRRCDGDGSRLPRRSTLRGARDVPPCASGGWRCGDPAQPGIERAKGACRGRPARPAARRTPGARSRRQVDVLDF